MHRNSARRKKVISTMDTQKKKKRERKKVIEMSADPESRGVGGFGGGELSCVE